MGRRISIGMGIDFDSDTREHDILRDIDIAEVPWSLPNGWTLETYGYQDDFAYIVVHSSFKSQDYAESWPGYTLSYEELKDIMEWQTKVLGTSREPEIIAWTYG